MVSPNVCRTSRAQALKRCIMIQFCRLLLIAALIIPIGCSSNRHGVSALQPDERGYISLVNEGWGDPSYTIKPEFTVYRSISFFIPTHKSGSYGPSEVSELVIGSRDCAFEGKIEVNLEAGYAIIRMTSAKDMKGKAISVGDYNGKYKIKPFK